MKLHRPAFVAFSLVCLTASFAFAQAAAPAKPAEKKPAAKPTATAPAKPNPADTAPTTEPVNRDGARHQLINSRAKPGEVDLLFIGDSITQGWEGNGKEAWEKYFGKRKPMNAGISGDRTQHVLWRLENGNIKGITPKLAVIMIGTNNSARNTSEEIAAGVTAIVNKLRQELPQMKILLLATFPRGENADNKNRKVNEGSNAIVAKLADGKMIHYLDIGPKLMNADGTISKDVMYDLLHLTAKGYDMWGAAIDDKVAELLGEKK